MRYIGFDIGTKKIGVAYSDESGQFAFPEIVLKNDANLFNAIFDICTKYAPKAFVVGDSASGTQSANIIQKHIKSFIRELESRFGLPVCIINEHGTSHAAKLINLSMAGQKHTQATKRSVSANDSVDAQAAAMLLQRFLDSQPRT